MKNNEETARTVRNLRLTRFLKLRIRRTMNGRSGRTKYVWGGVEKNENGVWREGGIVFGKRKKRERIRKKEKERKGEKKKRKLEKEEEYSFLL